jgi:hypothetical protein
MSKQVSNSRSNVLKARGRILFRLALHLMFGYALDHKTLMDLVEVTRACALDEGHLIELKNTIDDSSHCDCDICRGR